MSNAATVVPSARAVTRLAVASALIGAVAGSCLGLLAPAAVPLAMGGVASAAVRHNEVTGSDLDPVTRGGAEVWLVVGSDARSGAAAGQSDAGAPQGRRADTLLLFALPPATADGGGPLVLALPRDLAVRPAGYGTQRLGGLLDYGEAVLVRGVRAAFRVPVHHYVEVDMGAVVAAVDAIGGVPVDIPYQVRDAFTGLDLPAGRQLLDGQQALAYVRSRQHEERRDGTWVEAGGGSDRDRIDRQLTLLAAARDRLAGRLQPGLAWALLDALTTHATTDEASGAADLAGLAAMLRVSPWSARVLPVERTVAESESLSPFPPAHRGTARTARAVRPEAERVLESLRPPQEHR